MPAQRQLTVTAEVAHSDSQVTAEAPFITDCAASSGNLQVQMIGTEK